MRATFIRTAAFTGSGFAAGFGIAAIIPDMSNGGGVGFGSATSGPGGSTTFAGGWAFASTTGRAGASASS
jgi:hypothetical protein